MHFLCDTSSISGLSVWGSGPGQRSDPLLPLRTSSFFFLICFHTLPLFNFKRPRNSSWKNDDCTARVLCGCFWGQHISQINAFWLMLILWKMSATEVCGLWGRSGDRCGYVFAWELHRWKEGKLKIITLSVSQYFPTVFLPHLHIWPGLVKLMCAKLNWDHLKEHCFQKNKTNCLLFV